jgi:hypothetical protein
MSHSAADMLPPLGPDTARQCPWCQRWALKDDACNWVCCGLETASNRFVLGSGCGRQWCFLCGKRLCGAMFDAHSGQPIPGVSTHHTQTCCLRECCGMGVASGHAGGAALPPDMSRIYAATYCQGGHNSHR